MNENLKKNWTREELILAINLYCKTPFGRIHYRNPAIIELAEKLGRTPGSVSYKLANIANIDPLLDRKGASNVSKLDRQVWSEFFENSETVFFESELQMQRLQKGEAMLIETENIEVLEGKTRQALVKARVNQNLFRQMVLVSYDMACCITDINLPDLLIASHISPWSVDEKNRLNPRNGLCLNALHDRAFDTGWISLDENYRVIVSQHIDEFAYVTGNIEMILKYKGRRMRFPSRFMPDPSFLKTDYYFGSEISLTPNECLI